ncbi:MAG: DUF4421 family protein [Bacteroidales bacterium]|nr:DUF4421 family protein [Bacteroidales bacterium]
MTLNRTLLALAAAALFFVPARAQESGFRAFIDRIAGPSPELNPEAIYQPKPRFHFALTGDIRQANMDEEKLFEVGVGHFDGYNVTYEEIPARISSSMSSDLDKAVGFQAGYGNLSLALSKKIKGQGKDDYFSFDFLSAGFAVQVQYFNLLQPVTYRYTVGEEGHWAYSDQEGTTENPSNLRTFIVDAFYAFNRRSFAYSAAYKGNLFQRRSAGSWMFGSKLILGDYGIDPSEPIAGWAGQQSLQTSAQVAFGGGYSFNLVPYHRQPTGDRDKGLRNVTINATFLPMVTLFNQFTSKAFDLGEDGKYALFHKSVMNGKLLVNYVARVGIGWSYNLFTANLSASMDSFSYKGNSEMSVDGLIADEVATSGRFARYTVALRLGMRF